LDLLPLEPYIAAFAIADGDLDLFAIISRLLETSPLLKEKGGFTSFLQNDGVFWICVGARVRPETLKLLNEKSSSANSDGFPHLHLEKLSVVCRKSIHYAAVRFGYPETIRYLLDTPYSSSSNPFSMKEGVVSEYNASMDAVERALQLEIGSFLFENNRYRSNGSVISYVKYFSEKKKFQNAFMELLTKSCEYGDLESLKYAISVFGYELPPPDFVDGCATSGFFKRVDSYHLETAIRSGNLELVKYLETEGNQKHTGPLQVALLSGSFDIARYYAYEKELDGKKGLPYDKKAIMAMAVGDSDPATWSFAKNELGGILSPDCYVEAFAHENLESVKWLDLNKCPNDPSLVASTLAKKCYSLSPILLFLEQNPGYLFTDDQIHSAMRHNAVDIVSFFLLEHRPDFQPNLTPKDVISCLQRSHLPYASDGYWKLFDEIHYKFTKLDLVNAISMVDYESAMMFRGPKESLAEALIQRGYLRKEIINDDLIKFATELIKGEEVKKGEDANVRLRRESESKVDFTIRKLNMLR